MDDTLCDLQAAAEEAKTEKEQLQKEWEEMKLGLMEKVSGLTQPAIKLSRSASRTITKLGGNPTVDDNDFSWPTFKGIPLNFLAQFDLAEISKKHKYDWLAESGALLFFYDFEAWGFDPKLSRKIVHLAAVEGNRSTRFC